MIYLILSRKGYSDLKYEFVESGNSFWISGNILSKEEAEEHWEKNVNLTVISNEIGVGNSNEIKNVLHDIAEHHPGETIWMERENAL